MENSYFKLICNVSTSIIVEYSFTYLKKNLSTACLVCYIVVALITYKFKFVFIFFADCVKMTANDFCITPKCSIL